MGKNNRLINSLKEIASRNRMENVGRAADEMVPQIYAAVALALHNTAGFGYKRINDVFAESQRIWERFEGKGEDMIKQCEEVTGIIVCTPEEFEKFKEAERIGN